MTILTADHPMPRGIHTAEVVATNGNVLLVLLALYPLLRFVAGSISLAALGVAVVILIVACGRSLNGRIFIALPFALLTLAAAVGGYLQDDSIVGNYFFFETLYLISVPLLGMSTIRYDDRLVRAVSLTFILICLAFLVYPDLTRFGSAKYTEAFVHNIVDGANLQDNLHDMIGLAEDRFHAYFIHSNEFGLFAAGLLVIQGKLLMPEPPQRMAKIDFVLAATIFFLILFSQSITAIYVIGVAIMLGLGNARVVLWFTFCVFSFLFITQMFYAMDMANYLQEGSFWWRYIMADEVLGAAPIFRFDPIAVTGLENWPHSILLDATFPIGRIGPFILYISVSTLALLALPPRLGAGLFAFFTCAALQPSGAMPSSFLMLLVALVPATLVESRAQQLTARLGTSG